MISGTVLAALPIATDDPGDFLAEIAGLSVLSHWRLGETSGLVAADVGPSANNGTYNGLSPGQAGAIRGDSDGCVQFDGFVDYVEIPHSPDYLIDSASVHLWFNVDALGNTQYIFSKDAFGYVTGGHLSMWVTFSGAVRVRLQSTTGDHFVQSPNFVSPGTWHNVVFTFGAGGMRLYTDGRLADTDPYTGGLATSSGGAGNFEPIAIGASTRISSSGSVLPLQDYFDGTIDEVAIFDTELTAGQVQDLYAAARQYYTLNKNSSLVIASIDGVLINDFDVESDSLWTLLDGGPSSASSFSLNSDGSFAYTPLLDFTGTDTFTYQASDASGTSNIATVTITVNEGPSLASAIPDTTVDEDNPPIDNYCDLNAVFADPEQGGALSFSVMSNSNPAVIAATIDADSALDLSFGPNAYGSATIVIRATDIGGLFVEDTFVVTANAVNDTPMVATTIILDNATGSTSVSTPLAFSHAIGGGSNRLLVVGIGVEGSTTSDDDVLGVTYNGVSLTRAVAHGVGFGRYQNDEIWYQLESSLPPPGTYTVSISVEGSPDDVKAGAISVSRAAQQAPEATAFNDDGETGSTRIQTSLTTLTDWAWIFDCAGSGNAVSLTPDAGQAEHFDLIGSSSGVAGSTKEKVTAGAETLGWTTDGASNRLSHVLAAFAPVAGAIPDTTVNEDNPAIDNYRDLNAVFADIEDGSALSFSVESNSNPALVIAAIDADSALDLSFAPESNGSAQIVIRADDSGTLFADDTLIVTVIAVSDPPVAADDPGYSELVMALRPVSYWRLGETVGPTAIDELGSNNGTYNGPTLGEGGAIRADTNTAARFDGVDDYVEVGTFDVNGTGITLLGWFNADDFGIPQARIISKTTDTAIDSHYWMLGTDDVSGEKRLRALLKTGGSTAAWTASRGALSTGQYHFAALTYEGSMMRLYLDGVQVDSLAKSGAVDVNNGVPIWIGNNPTVPTSRPFDGLIDEVAVFAHALSDSQIQRLHKAGLAMYEVDEDGLLAIGASEGVLVNDTDADDDPLTSVLVSGPSNSASFMLNPQGSFTYAPDANFNGSDMFTYRAFDGSDSSNVAVAAITVNAVNDAPVNSVPAAQVTTEDVPLAFSTANGNSISVADVDASSNPVEVTLTAANGVLTLAGSSGLSFSAGDGSLDPAMTFNGTITDINNALDGLMFDPIPGYVGPASLQVDTNDQGYTGSGGPLVDSDTIAIDVDQGVGVIAATARRVWGLTVNPGSPPEPVFLIKLVNSGTSADTLVSITFSNTTLGQGSQAELDSDWSLLTLTEASGADLLPGGGGPPTGTFSLGRATFDSLEAAIPAGDTLNLIVSGGASLVARDGDQLDLMLADSTAIAFASPVQLLAAWPLNPADVFPVDGMVAQQISLDPVGASVFPTDSNRNLALDLVLPPNGYEPDTLNKLNVTNLGTALNAADIQMMEAWVDDGDSIFNPSADSLLGSFSYTGSRWEITGLSVYVPTSGLRVFATVNIAQMAAEGRTIRLCVPAVPDVAIGMESGNDGPIDVAVANPFAQSISSSESVILTAALLSSATVIPGQQDVLLLQLIATNNYSIEKQITGLAIDNDTQTQNTASQADLDGEIQLLKLRIDGNDNGVLDDVVTDPVVGFTFFNSGKATFTGIAWNLPAGTSRHAFITAGISLGGAADGDIIAVRIGGILDVDFADQTNVVAAWPLSSNAELTIDGMLASQIACFDVLASTLAPGDGPVLALDLIVPRNGYADDILRGFEVINLGTAGPSDIGDLRLWRDGGDGAFSGGGGDDVEISPLVYSGGSWKSVLLSETLASAGARLFVGLTVSGAPADSVTIRFALPDDGIEVESGNDGPIDGPVENSEAMLLSSNPLLVALDVSPAVSTVGQTVSVQMIVRNVGMEQINAISPSALTLQGSAGFNLSAGPQPAAFDLASAATDTITWIYIANGAGSMQWEGYAQGTGAISGLPRTSLEAASNLHQVFLEAGEVTLFATESMPFMISQGQRDVVPLSLTFFVPENPDASSARLRSLRIRLEDGQAGGIIPADLLSRVIVSEGNNTYLAKTVLETSGSEVDLTLATPVTVAPLEPVTLGLRMDILAATVVPEFRVVITDSTWIVAEDAISGAPAVVRLQEGSYPIASGLGRLVAPPTELDVQATGNVPQRLGRGQLDVPLLTVQLDNAGISGLTTDVAITGFAVGLVDTNGIPISNPSQIFDRLIVTGQSIVYADRHLGSQDSTLLTLALSPLAEVEVNMPMLLTVAADIAENAVMGACRLRLADSTYFDARDANSGAAVPVIYQSQPIEGADVIIEAPAESLAVRGAPAFPQIVNVGESDVTAFTIACRHPSPPGVGRIRLDEIAVLCQNELRNPLVPATYIERLRVFESGAEIADVTNLPAIGNRIDVPLPGLLLEPGETDTLEVRIDVSASAPLTFLELIVESSGIRAVDANIDASVVIAPEVGWALPVTSGLTQLLPPATELVVGLSSDMPAALVKGTAGLRVAELSVVNTASAGSGMITVDYLVLRAADKQFSSVPIGAVTRKITAHNGVSLLGESATLSRDSATAYVPFASPLVLQAGVLMDIQISMDLQDTIGVENFRVGVDSSDVGVDQPSSALFQVRIESKTGQRFPLWTEAGNFSQQDLSGSYSNFPNPFAAGREPTTFVYYLAKDAEVALRIWTARGEAVTTIRKGTRRPAGLYQDDQWDGRNDRGVVVVNGVYLAELVVRYTDGGGDRKLRKVAVVR
ncbi:MAG: tandem-95 repeat protein [Candidatus Latescibacteria bacterium]|nr:tandem-95 repeat protein [Candidatus Latescibacterota bacterium]NIT39221.1 tandem-95 repeat protein [Candidatus Latescibacterota bacterium]